MEHILERDIFLLRRGHLSDFSFRGWTWIVVAWPPGEPLGCAGVVFKAEPLRQTSRHTSILDTNWLRIDLHHVTRSRTQCVVAQLGATVKLAAPKIMNPNVNAGSAVTLGFDGQQLSRPFPLECPPWSTRSEWMNAAPEGWQLRLRNETNRASRPCCRAETGSGDDGDSLGLGALGLGRLAGSMPAPSAGSLPPLLSTQLSQ